MARNRYEVGNNFLNSFMQGYSFVDNIYARKKEEKRLEEELKLQRERQAKMDAIVFENQKFAREDRQRMAEFRSRGREAGAIMAGPNPNLDILAKDYSDIPGVLEYVQQERDKRGLRSDFDIANAGDPSFTSRVTAAAGAGGQQAAAPGPSEPGSMVVRANDPTMGFQPEPPAPSAMRPELVKTAYTQDQLNQMVLNKEITEQEARQIRDRQDDENMWVNAPTSPSDFDPYQMDVQGTGARKQRNYDRDKEREAAGETIRAAEKVARSFTDINDKSGDAYRDWSPSQALDWYHSNRNNIQDPHLREKTDKYMEERVQAVMDTNRVILDTVEVGSREWDKASREFSRGLGLIMDITTTRSPTELAGVDGRGLSVRDETRRNATIQHAAEGRYNPVPANPTAIKADMAVANRGNSGTRVSKAYANAAYGLLTHKIIDIDIYSQMINTGAPLGQILAQRGVTPPKFVQTDPTKATWIEYTDENGQLRRDLISGPTKQMSDEELENEYRNVFGREARDHLYKNLARQFNTKDDKDRGARMVNAFLADMAVNEARARAEGYSFNNVLDVTALFQRWSDAHVIRDVYNEAMGKKWFSQPTFSDKYGNIDQRIFDRGFDQEVQAAIAEEELTTSGGNPLRLTGLKDIGGADILWLRQQFPEETQYMSDAQIREKVLADDTYLER